MIYRYVIQWCRVCGRDLEHFVGLSSDFVLAPHVEAALFTCKFCHDWSMTYIIHPPPNEGGRLVLRDAIHWTPEQWAEWDKFVDEE